MSISIPTLEITQFCMPPDTKTKVISIQSLNQVIFDPHTKQVNYDPYIVKLSQPQFPTLKSRLFRPPTQQSQFRC